MSTAKRSSSGTKKGSKIKKSKCATLKKEEENIVSIGSETGQKKKKDNIVRKTWGDLRSKESRRRFNRYLNSLNSAERFLKPSGVNFYCNLPPGPRKKVAARLREVDPEGFDELVRRAKGRKNAARAKKQKEMAEEHKIRYGDVGVETQMNIAPNTSVVRFVDGDGIKGVIAICLASGYTTEEVGALIHMDPGKIVTLVTNDDIEKARRKVPNAIIKAADNMVLRDLLVGDISSRTEMADRISSRRKKLILDASGEAREQRKEDQALSNSREKHIAERFGVDRKTINQEEE